MLRRVLLAWSVMLSVVAACWGFEVNAVLHKVDVDHRVLTVLAGGQERTVDVTADAKLLDDQGKTLADGLQSKELKEGAKITLSVDRGKKDRPQVLELRLGHRAGGTDSGPGGSDLSAKTSIGLKPLTEMTADDRYKGEDGGLYGGGHNEPPATLAAAAKRVTAQIVPRDSAGKPASDGKIGLISISMSNATQEYSRFKQIADADEKKSPRVAVVDCAQGGQAMAEWVDPDARPWHEADNRLNKANVSPAQVQVAWVKLANKGPRGELSEHGRKLEKDTAAVARNAKQRFPNLQIVYLGSRIYGGYASSPLNPEPYAYESGFVARWLIQDQMKGSGDLNYDPEKGAVKAPLLLWGPYFWADGLTPRKSDSLQWERSDLGPDGTHPSEAGRQKVAEMLLKFFHTDSEAHSWYLRN